MSKVCGAGLFYLHLVAILVFLVNGRVTAQPDKVTNGLADLSTYDFKQGSFELNGAWEFYWNQLLKPTDFLQGNAKQPSDWIEVPKPWQRDKKYPALGYATYRVTLRLPDNHAGLAIYFPVINSAARIWFNNELVKEAGVVHSNPHKYLPKMTRSILPIQAGVKEVVIVLEVANFSYFRGGIFRVPVIGERDSIIQMVNNSGTMESFFAGSLIAMFIYQFILYFLYNRGKPYLWLSLICLGVALRSMVVHGGSFFLPNLLPELSWGIWKKMEFLCVYSTLMLFPLYVYHLFEQYAPRKPLWFFGAVTLVLCVAVLATPQHVYGNLLDAYNVAIILAFIYALYSITKAWRGDNPDAKIIFFGVVAAFPFILAELMRNSPTMPQNIKMLYWAEMGVLIFLLFQVYMLANHYALAYQNLEKMVQERTTQLTSANAVKNRLLSIMSHDIKSPLISLRGILAIYNKGAVTKEEFSEYTKQIESDLNKTSILMENILFWTASQLKGVQVKLEKVNLHTAIEENISLVETMAIKKVLQFEHNALPETWVSTDKNILNLALRNLLSNAIKFSNEGGKISVLVSKTTDALQITVNDEGVGIDEETMEAMNSHNFLESTTGTFNERGTGMGLSLSRYYLQKAGGTLEVESQKGRGSTFTISLPINPNAGSGSVGLAFI
jgi:two-component system sensor histidine kinase ChiS